MSTDPGQRARWGTINQLTWVGAFVLFQLVSLPLLVDRWGTQLYGDWLILFTVPVYVSLANLGLHVAVGNRVSGFIAVDEPGRAVALYRSYTRVVGLLGASLAAALALTCWRLDVRSAFGLEAISTADARLIAGLLVLYACSGIYAGTFPVAFRLTERFHVGIAYNAGFRIAELVLLLGAAALGASPVGVAWVLLGTRLAMTVALRVLAAREVASVLPDGPRSTRAGLREQVADLRGLGTASIAAAVFPFGTVVLCQGILLIISRSMSSRDVVAVNTFRTISNAIYQLSQAMSIGVLPEIATNLAKGAIEPARRLRSAYLSALWILGGGFSIVAVIVLGPALRVWTDGEVAPDRPLVAMLLLAALLDATALALASGAIATNTHQRFAATYVAISTGVLVLVGLTLEADRLWIVGAALVLGGVLVVIDALGESKRAFGDAHRTDAACDTLQSASTLVRRPRELVSGLRGRSV